MKKLISFTLLIFILTITNSAYGQFGEPEVQEKETPRNLFDEGYRAGFGFNLALSDFGIGAGGQFRLGLSRYTEGIITLRVSALKDPSEQTFTNYFGYQTIPEKYQRVLSVPLYVGLKKRIFAEGISDNFRVFSSLSAGPAFAFSYSYFKDYNGNGYREADSRLFLITEPVNDIFSGWDNSETHWGFGGEFVIGVDFGENFSNLSSVQFGYTMNYFADGIQILEACQPDLTRLNQAPINPCGSGIETISVGPNNDQAPFEKAHDPRKYFGSAQISFVFGWMW